jgi:hypothetical protein
VFSEGRLHHHLPCFLFSSFISAIYSKSAYKSNIAYDLNHTHCFLHSRYALSQN